MCWNNIYRFCFIVFLVYRVIGNWYGIIVRRNEMREGRNNK